MTRQCSRSPVRRTYHSYSSMHADCYADDYKPVDGDNDDKPIDGSTNEVFCMTFLVFFWARWLGIVIHAPETLLGTLLALQVVPDRRPSTIFFASIAAVCLQHLFRLSPQLL